MIYPSRVIFLRARHTVHLGGHFPRADGYGDGDTEYATYVAGKTRGEMEADLHLRRLSFTAKEQEE